MIAFLKGKLAYTSPDMIVIDVNGVGYEVYVTTETLGKLPPTGSELQVFTYMYVREDICQLYGFLRREDLQFFKLLISVNGIGPKGAIGILSSMTVETLKFAILADDAKTVAKAQGIGPKTAKKLVLELRDKLNLESEVESLVGGTPEAMPVAAEAGDPYAELRSDAMQALTALGFGGAEAMKAVKEVEITEGMTADDVLKMAMHKF